MNEGPAPLRFMTFNIRFDTVLDEPAGNRWADRVESVLETVASFRPHVVGFQEALSGQLADLIRAFPDYRVVGKPRDVGETAEFVPLFIDRTRLDVEEHGDFWLSTTPETEGSRGWDADVPRHCSWARVRDRTSGAVMAVLNTHLDRWGVLARLEAARLLAARVALAPDVPAVVMGDFNAEEESEPVGVLLGAGLRDTFRMCHPDAEDVQTIHHYKDLSGPQKIDYIFCTPGWHVVSAAIVRDPAAGRLPSDHFPVVTELVPQSERAPARTSRHGRR